MSCNHIMAHGMCRLPQSRSVGVMLYGDSLITLEDCEISLEDYQDEDNGDWGFSHIAHINIVYDFCTSCGEDLRPLWLAYKLTGVPFANPGPMFDD